MSSSSSIVGDLWRSELEIEFPRTVRVLIDYFRRNGFIRIDRELVEKYPEYKWSLYRGWWNTALDI